MSFSRPDSRGDGVIFHLEEKEYDNDDDLGKARYIDETPGSILSFDGSFEGS